MSNTRSSSGQRLVLKICVGIIVVGGGILAIDKFIVRKGEPAKSERLSNLAAEYDLREGGATERKRLKSLLQSFNAQDRAPDPVGGFLFREDEVHTLWLFEYEEQRTALHHSRRQDSTVKVTLFGILFELKEAVTLPEWQQAVTATPPVPPHTLTSIGQLSRLADYHMSMQGNCLLFNTSIETWALKQAINQQTSAEFHAGLFNSAMKVDVQSTVNLVNSLESGASPLPSFYTIDLPDIKIAIPKNTGISNRLSEINRETHEKIAADLEASDLKYKAIREENRKKMEAIQAKMNKNMERHRVKKVTPPPAPAVDVEETAPTD